ncbi:uncharacterized protein LOC129726515 [Wyeomyia smithii]|uniref:uncharacterized protein LOC129726515 n=1 Tax=Wyeomyia smithii TaxID=174621 RepID=UPI00246810C3|nr:uncharacterized protein LOC129726515 [Wyeomyia smithii]
MQFKLFFLLMLNILVRGGDAFTCNACDGRSDCDAGGQTVECTVARVSNLQNLYSYVNPSLTGALPPNPEFVCFDMDLYYRSPLTGSMVRKIVRDCAIRQMEFCKHENWINAESLDCTECLGENCNAIQVTGTPAVSSTTSATSPSPAPSTAASTSVQPGSSSAASTTVTVPASPTTVASTSVQPGSSTTSTTAASSSVSPGQSSTVASSTGRTTTSTTSLSSGAPGSFSSTVPSTSTTPGGTGSSLSFSKWTFVSTLLIVLVTIVLRSN